MKRALLIAFVFSLLNFCPEALFCQKTFDQHIDEGFSPISDFISDIVFFSPIIKDEIIYKEVGENKPKEDFYENLPYEISFEKNGNQIPYGQEIQITYAAADSFHLTGIINGQKQDTILVYDRGKYEIEGFEFNLKYHPASPYPIEPGRIYSFKAVIIHLPPIPVILLILIAIYLSIKFGFIGFRSFGLAWAILRNQYLDRYGRSPLSHFQALSTALSGSLGLGNISGVGIAIVVGGVGAIFWMILAGILAMAVKFTSATLGMRYREYDTKGISYGGPMYYLHKGLEEKGFAKLGRGLAIAFAILCIGTAWGIGNMFQVNQASQQILLVSGEMSHLIAPFRWVLGLIFGGIILFVLLGGIRRVAWLSEKLVPFMSLLYIIGTLWVIGTHIPELPTALLEIVRGAFLPLSVAGGIMGCVIQGFSAALFSNEAGLGSSTIAHSSAGARDATSQGLVAMLEPFIDTVLICTLTALTVVLTGSHYKMSADDGIEIVAAAFRDSLPLADYIFTVIVVLFAFSSMIAWAYYGLKAWQYLLGTNQRLKIVYFALHAIFTVLGSLASFSSIISFSKSMMFALAMPHIVGLIILAPEVRAELTKYITKLQRGDIKKRT